MYPPARLAWAIWGLAASLYCMAFFQRVAPAVMTTELTSAFALTATSLGNLSAFYFYSYVALQIPTGLAADRFGPRVLLVTGAAVATFGILVFALAPSLVWANFGRLLIGGATGVAFVCMLKLAMHWMPPTSFALASAMGMVVGVTGATLAGAPLRLLVDAFGWREVSVSCAAVTLLMAVAIWHLVRDDPSARGFASYFGNGRSTSGPASLRAVWAGFVEVLTYRNIVLLFFIPGAVSSIVLSFAGLWGVPFLATTYALSKAHAAGLCSLMMIAWALGSLAYAPISQRLGARRLPFFIGLVVTYVLWAALVFVPNLPYGLLVALLLATGFAAGAFILVFPFAKESVPARLAGTVSGIVNMGVMTGGMLMQPLIGWTLDRHWRGVVENGSRLYDLPAYQSAFALTFAWGAMALALLLLTKETYNQGMD